jgi:hypothetical protein
MEYLNQLLALNFMQSIPKELFTALAQILISFIFAIILSLKLIFPLLFPTKAILRAKEDLEKERLKLADSTKRLAYATGMVQRLKASLKGQ